MFKIAMATICGISMTIVSATNCLADQLTFAVYYCGKNVDMESQNVKEVCYVGGSQVHHDLLLRYIDGTQVRFRILSEGSEFSSTTNLSLGAKGGQYFEATLYRHYARGEYPGDGENYPIAIRGTTPDGTKIDVIEVVYEKSVEVIADEVPTYTGSRE